MIYVTGYTPLCEAVWRKSAELAHLLLNAGAKVSERHFLLHYAVLRRQVCLAKLLLNAGCNPNSTDLSGDTPLIIAARTHDTDMAELLLENGTHM